MSASRLARKRRRIARLGLLVMAELRRFLGEEDAERAKIEGLPRTPPRLRPPRRYIEIDLPCPLNRERQQERRLTRRAEGESPLSVDPKARREGSSPTGRRRRARRLEAWRQRLGRPPRNDGRPRRAPGESSGPPRGIAALGTSSASWALRVIGQGHAPTWVG